jgi:hypothetical protein
MHNILRAQKMEGKEVEIVGPIFLGQVEECLSAAKCKQHARYNAEPITAASRSFVLTVSTAKRMRLPEVTQE